MSEVQLQEVLQDEADSAWVDLGGENDVFGDDDCASVVVGERRIGIFRVEGEVYALDDICTHGNARLSEGELDGFEIECPLHAGAFDVRNGKALCAPLTRDTKCHAVCRKEGRILIKVQQS